MKLAGNVLTATTLQCMGEVLALLRKGGIDQHLAFDVLTNSVFDSKVHRTYGGKIVDQRYSPAGMAVPLAINLNPAVGGLPFQGALRNLPVWGHKNRHR